MTTNQNMNYETATFEELSTLKSGTILEDAYLNGVRYIIVRGPVALCAYVGVPSGHPLANRDYNELPLSVHGGLTYAGEGDDKPWPKGYYWYGWDYGHYGDVTFYDLIPGFSPLHDGFSPLHDRAATRWTFKQVKSEIWDATYEFSRLVKLVEKVTQ